MNHKGFSKAKLERSEAKQEKNQKGGKKKKHSVLNKGKANGSKESVFADSFDKFDDKDQEKKKEKSKDNGKKKKTDEDDEKKKEAAKETFAQSFTNQQANPLTSEEYFKNIQEKNQRNQNGFAQSQDGPAFFNEPPYSE